MITAQEQTRSDVKRQPNPGQALGDRLHFPDSTRNPEVTEPGGSDLEGHDWMPKREQQSASSSSGRNESRHSNAQASGDRF